VEVIHKTLTIEQSADDKIEEELQERIKSLNSELDKMAPNTRAMERLESVENNFVYRKGI